MWRLYRIYSVYVHPFQVLQSRTIWFFCPSCHPPSALDSARKKEGGCKEQAEPAPKNMPRPNLFGRRIFSHFPLYQQVDIYVEVPLDIR